MSTQINQYFMYGILVPYDWYKEWEKKSGKDFHDTFNEFMNDNAYDTIIKHKDGIFCLFNGRDGRYIIIGKVLEKTEDDDPFLGNGNPLVVPEIEIADKAEIENAVYRYFELEGDFHYYFVTHYR